MERNQEVTWSRWKPTERQKEILEELFKQGHHKPSRSQIKEFTKLLQPHGDIEAKNVFYWFQNNHARRKRKHEKETSQMQLSRLEPTTPESLNEKDTVKSLEGQICSSPTREKRKQKEESSQMQQSRFKLTPKSLNEKDTVKRLKAHCIIVDSSKGMAELSAQGSTNSPESACSTSTQKMLPTDLSWKHHIQSVRKETFSDGLGQNVAGRIDEWVDHFTVPLRSNVMTNCSDAEELELFPLHSDGNLRSKYNSSFQGDEETNDIIYESGKWLSLKFVL